MSDTIISLNVEEIKLTEINPVLTTEFLKGFKFGLQGDN